MKLNLLLSLLFPITSVLIPLAVQAQDNPALEVESFDEFLFPDLDDTEMNLDTPSLNQPQFNPQFNPTSGEITPIATFNTDCQRVDIFRRDYQSESLSEFQVGRGRDRLFMSLVPLSQQEGCVGITGVHPVSTANGLNGKDYSFVTQGVLIRAYIPENSTCSLLEFRSGFLADGVIQEYEQGNCLREDRSE
ncbi:hypothetical protein PN462_19475 [Spirulina sp. CS-785/01]|uniref:hypothetical protein n=1 Tax=Spirulina sp. CS-785/01 TaxID=3021716 RepID=UPI00232C618B|nr:hypothetical protein [Spirulina sp. CS-785/01]MDB9315305.1 hypothetical protein [Spirulina sp. CS-785/01]